MGVIVYLFIVTSKHVVFGRFVWTDGIAFVLVELATNLEGFGIFDCWSGIKTFGI